MAISLGSRSRTIESLRRTWRVTIETALNTDYILTAHREVVKKEGMEMVAKDQNAGTVQRSLSKVLKEEYTCLDGTIVTPEHIAEALSALIDRWETEDSA